MRAACALLALPFLLAAAEVRIADDFSRYAEGATAAEGWETDGIAWQVKDGRYASDWLGGAEASPTDRRIFRTVTVEAVMTPRQATGKDWKIAGVGLKVDGRNFWHLAFVEAPEKEKNRHLVELSEMRDGQWLSQNNLKNTQHTGAELAWAYGTAYRLRLALTPEGIEGKVLDMQGKTLSHLAYAFSAEAVTEGRPCLRTSRMAADFDDVLVVADGATARLLPPPVEKTFPPYAVKGSGRKAPVASTGFFQVMKQGERWWVVDPRGELFYAVGTDHVNYYSHWCQTLGYAPYHKNAEKLYGSVEKWATSATERLRAWGFNLLGAGNIEPARYQGLAHTLFVAFGSNFSGASALVEKVHWTGFPNVFDPRWEAYCDSLAKKSCAVMRRDPWLFGYFLDNELEWYGKTHRIEGIWTDTMKWPADHTGKLALIARVRQAHNSDLADFNQVWKQQAASWEDLAKLDALPAVSDRAREIQEAFLVEVADRYFRIATAAIRKADPNHLIIGSRFAGNAPEWAWQACAKYCDIVTFNQYPRVDMETEDLTPIADVYSKYYALVDKPMMVTEWSFPALDAGLPSKHGAGMRVDTQEQKTHCVEMLQHLHFRLPFVVGSDYFMWADEPKEGISEHFPEDSNYGLNDVNDQPYPLLTGMFTKLNPMAIALHAGEIPEGYIDSLTVAEGKVQVVVRNASASQATFLPTVRSGGKTVSAARISLSPGATAAVNTTVDLAPGCHVLEAELEREGDWAPRGCRGRTRATACAVVPGPGVPAQDLLALRNPTAQPLPAAWAVVFLPGRGGQPGAATSLRTTDGADLPAIWIAPGVLGVQTPELSAGQTISGQLAQTATPGETVKSELLPDGGFRIDNGVLRLEHDGKSGNVIDRIQLGGLPLGSYNPLVWQEPRDNQWTKADTFVKAELRPGSPLVVDVTTECRNGAAITAVDEDGKMPEAEGAPARFRVTHRFVVWPNCPYIAARLVRIVNLEGKRPLRLNGYFFYMPSDIGGDGQGDEPIGANVEVPNYYRHTSGTAWHDAKVQARYGVVGAGTGLLARFWLNNGGGQHPDARVEVKPTLEVAPGQEFAAPEDAPIALIYGASDQSWPQVERQLHAATHIQLLTP